MANRKYTAEQQAFIVACIAEYMSYGETIEAFKERYGIELSRTTIQHYDPRYEPGPAQKLKDLHDAIRKKFNEDLVAQPMNSLTFRQRERLKAMRKAASQGNFGLLKELLADGSREATGGFGRRMELTGADGGPIRTEATVDVGELSTELLRKLAEELKGERDGD